jgi:hypothetical protein
MRRERRGV